MPGPAAVEVAARHVRVGGEYAATLAVTGYPAEVSARLAGAAAALPRPAGCHLAHRADPGAGGRRAAAAAARPAGIGAPRRRRPRPAGRPRYRGRRRRRRDLAYRLARGEGKLFRLGLYLTIHATSEEELAAEVTTVRALAASLLLVTVPATFRSLQAGHHAPGRRRRAAAAPHHGHRRARRLFPVHLPDLPRDPARPSALPGVLYGANTAGRGWWLDRWAADNHNSVTLAASGAGKSYLAKLEILRSLYQGTECWVIDPEDEYARLAAATGGAHIHLGAPGVHLNPFDLPAAARARPDTLTRRALFLHTVVAVLCAASRPRPSAPPWTRRSWRLPPAGITADPAPGRGPPAAGGPGRALRAAKSAPATVLADRLVPFTEGSHAGLFAAPTTTRPDGHLWSSASRRPRRAAPRRDPARPGRDLAAGL